MDTTTPSWAGRAVQAPTVPPTPEEPRSNTLATITAGALIAIGIGVAGFFIGQGLGSESAPVAAQAEPSESPDEPTPTEATTTDEATTDEGVLAPAEPTVAPSTTVPAVAEIETDEPSAAAVTMEPAERLGDGAAADDQAIASADGTVDDRAATTNATPSAGEEPVRAAVLSGGVLYLRGAVPSQGVADLIAERAAAVIGADNVVVEYTIDPNSSVPESAPLSVEDVVLFAYGSDEVNPAFAPLLDLGTLLMTQNPQVTVTIVSHTDTDGSAEFNLDLSRRRGGAIARYWIERGIAPDRIAIDARGESQPRADESSPEGAQANRRAEFVITGLLG